MNTFRNLLQKNRYLIGVVSLLVLAVASYLAIRQAMPPKVSSIEKLSFIDTETGEESLRDRTEIPPLVGTRGGPTVVRAHYYVPGDGSPKILAYLTRFKPEAQEVLKRVVQTHSPLSAADRDIVERGGEYCLPGPSAEWKPASPDMMSAATVQQPPQ